MIAGEGFVQWSLPSAFNMVRGIAAAMRNVEENIEFIYEELKPFPH